MAETENRGYYYPQVDDDIKAFPVLQESSQKRIDQDIEDLRNSTPGLVIDDSVGRTITLGGERLSYDSGWRDMSEELVYGWVGGECYIRRLNDEILISFKGLDGTNATNASCVPLATGFQPDMFTGQSQAFWVRGDTTDIWGSAGTGFMRLQAKWVSRKTTWSSIRFPAEAAMPESLPGKSRL